MLFKTGDKVRLKTDNEYKGTVTKTKYVPSNRGREYQFIWLDGGKFPSGYTSEQFELDN